MASTANPRIAPQQIEADIETYLALKVIDNYTPHNTRYALPSAADALARLRAEDRSRRARFPRCQRMIALARYDRHMRARAGGKDVGEEDMNELRDYGIGAQILAELGIHDMVLLTNSHHTLVALGGYGLDIVGERAIDCNGAA